jgi:hypothetical protein
LGKNLLLDNEIWAFGGSLDGQIAYGGGIGKSLVDTIRKLVIIAVCGKIGNPLSLACASNLRNREQKVRHHPELEHDGMTAPAAMELP